MSFVTEILTPLIQLLVYLALIFWICYICYWTYKKYLYNVKWHIKYDLFRKNCQEEDVEICMKATESQMTKGQLKGSLLLEGKSIGKVNEILFLFNKVKNELKGGL